MCKNDEHVFYERILIRFYLHDTTGVCQSEHLRGVLTRVACKRRGTAPFVRTGRADDDTCHLIEEAYARLERAVKQKGTKGTKR